MKIVYLVGVLVLFLGVFSTAFAQLSATATGVGPRLAITLSPTTPEAGEKVQAFLQTHTLTGSPQSITWTVNGTVQAEAANQNTMNFTAGQIGSRTTVRATVTMRDGTTHTAEAAFAVNQLDIIIDSDTSVPGFFVGRPEPSIGSRVKLTALLKDVDPASHTYAWKLNNTVLNGGPVRGGYTQVVTLPLGRNTTLGVDVYDATNILVGSKRIQIKASEPEIIFYEDNPLRGLMTKALTNNTTITSEEITVRGEPYFLSNNLPNGQIHREWSVNGRSVTSANQNPNTITLEKANNRRFSLEFHIRNLSDLLQGSKDSVQLSF